jgi:hypothetical protein
MRVSAILGSLLFTAHGRRQNVALMTQLARARESNRLDLEAQSMKRRQLPIRTQPATDVSAHKEASEVAKSPQHITLSEVANKSKKSSNASVSNISDNDEPTKKDEPPTKSSNAYDEPTKKDEPTKSSNAYDEPNKKDEPTKSSNASSMVAIEHDTSLGSANMSRTSSNATINNASGVQSLVQGLASSNATMWWGILVGLLLGWCCCCCLIQVIMKENDNDGNDFDKQFTEPDSPDYGPQSSFRKMNKKMKNKAGKLFSGGSGPDGNIGT